MNQDLRSTWSAENGWRIDSPRAMKRPQLERVRDYLLRVQTQRLQGLSVGPVRDECLRTIDDLTPGTERLSVNLTAERDGTRTPFASTERMTSRVFSY